MMVEKLGFCDYDTSSQYVFRVVPLVPKLGIALVVSRDFFTPKGQKDPSKIPPAGDCFGRSFRAV